MPYLNPQAGPIMVRGGPARRHHMRAHPEDGPHAANSPGVPAALSRSSAASPAPTSLRPSTSRCRRSSEKFRSTKRSCTGATRIKLPYRPHIGTLSCSPEIDSINSLTPDSHGGNMDLPDMGPGTVTYLPVRVEGARVFIGDAHACQGRWRGLRGRGRIPDLHHHHGEPDQGSADRVAAARGRRLHHGDRQHATAGGRRAYRLPRAHLLAGA